MLDFETYLRASRNSFHALKIEEGDILTMVVHQQGDRSGATVSYYQVKGNKLKPIEPPKEAA